MGILQTPQTLLGQNGIWPSRRPMQSTDNLSTVTTAGYLNSSNLGGQQLSEKDIVWMQYGCDAQGNNGTFGIFSVAISASGVITLTEYQSSSGVNATLPTTANHIAVYSNTAGDITEDASTAINVGNIQAGEDASAGSFISYPAITSTGVFKISASASSIGCDTILTNGTMGQDTTLTLPNPNNATANILLAPASITAGNLIRGSIAGGVGSGVVQDAGFAIKANTTAAYAGGGTSNAFTATGLTSAFKVTASILTSTNDVAIVKVVPGTDTLTVTFSADPGANTTVNYIAISAAV